MINRKHTYARRPNYITKTEETLIGCIKHTASQ